MLLLSLTIFPALKMVLSKINVATWTFFWFVFTYSGLLYSFTFYSHVYLYSSWIPCRQYMPDIIYSSSLTISFKWFVNNIDNWRYTWVDMCHIHCCSLFVAIKFYSYFSFFQLWVNSISIALNFYHFFLRTLKMLFYIFRYVVLYC